MMDGNDYSGLSLSFLSVISSMVLELIEIENYEDPDMNFVL
jgi:hypothetical protein